MITFTYSHFMRPWRVTDYLISQILFVSMQRLSQFFSQLVNQSLSCALFVFFFQHCLFNWRNTNQYRFFNFNSNIFCKCLWRFFSRSYRSHVDWFAYKFEVLHFKIHFIVVGVGVLWGWSFIFCLLLFLGICCGDKESERSLVISNYPTSLYIFIDYLDRGGTSIDSSIHRWSQGARGIFLKCVLIYWHAIKCK